MNTKLFFVLVITFFGLSNASAQLQEAIHESFDIEDAQKIVLDLAGDFEIVPWAGNTVMTHIEIELSDATPAILRYYVGAGRYDIIGKSEGDVYKVSSKDKRNKAIFFKELECYEHTLTKVFVPDSFQKVNKTTLVYQEDGDPFGEGTN